MDKWMDGFVGWIRKIQIYCMYVCKHGSHGYGNGKWRRAARPNKREKKREKDRSGQCNVLWVVLGGTRYQLTDTLTD